MRKLDTSSVFKRLPHPSFERLSGSIAFGGSLASDRTSIHGCPARVIHRIY